MRWVTIGFSISAIQSTIASNLDASDRFGGSLSLKDGTPARWCHAMSYVNWVRRSVLLRMSQLPIGFAVLQLPGCSKRNIAFVGDSKHYFDVQHARVLRALGSDFFSRFQLDEHRHHIEFEQPATMARVVAQLAASPPEMIAVVGDDEAMSIKTHFADTPTIFYVDHDPVASGLVESTAYPNSNCTGVASDVPEFVNH